MAAVNGAATVVRIAVSFWCGFVSNEYIFDDESVYDGDHPVIESENEQMICKDINDYMDDALRDNVRACDLVILMHRSYAHDDKGKLDANKRATARAAQLERYRGLQQLVTSKNAKLLLLGDVPELGTDGYRCAASSHLAATCEVTADQVRTNLQYERSAYEELAQVANTYYFPLSDLLCDDQTGKCGAYVPGTSTLVAKDRDHMLPETSLYLWPYICAFISDSGLLGG